MLQDFSLPVSRTRKNQILCFYIILIMKKGIAVDNKLIKNFVRQLKDIQDEENWLDENFKNKIDKISEEQAFKRPIEKIYSVAELVSHILVWRNESIRKLKGMKKNLTIDSPENWQTNDQLKEMGWKKLKTALYESQIELIELIKNQTDDYLENEYIEGYTFKYLIEDLVHHDLYHLGQIGVTIKLLNTKK